MNGRSPRTLRHRTRAHAGPQAPGVWKTRLANLRSRPLAPYARGSAHRYSRILDTLSSNPVGDAIGQLDAEAYVDMLLAESCISDVVTDEVNDEAEAMDEAGAAINVALNVVRDPESQRAWAVECHREATRRQIRCHIRDLKRHMCTLRAEIRGLDALLEARKAAASE